MTADRGERGGAGGQAAGRVRGCGWWEGAPEQGINFWQPNEVLTLVAPPADQVGNLDEVQRFLHEIFEKAGHRLDGQSFEHQRNREPLRLPRQDGPLYVQTAVLRYPPPSDTHDPDLLGPALQRTVDAARAVNNLAVPGQPTNNYRLLAATLNWLVMPFHG